MDQRRKFSSAGSSQEFPSLGSAAGGEGGPKPAGVWGKAAGHLAGEFSSQTPWQKKTHSLLVSDLSCCVLGRGVTCAAVMGRGVTSANSTHCIPNRLTLYHCDQVTNTRHCSFHKLTGMPADAGNPLGKF